MSKKVGLMDLFEGRNSALIALIVGVIFLILLETLIFIASSSASGEWTIVEVKDKQGNVIHRAKGASMADIDRWHFERIYGHLGNYDVAVATVNRPFPVRAWVSASIGIPVVLILLISYLIKVYFTLLHGNGTRTGEGYPVAAFESRHPFISWAMFLSSHSIFYLGAFIGAAALIFWMVPSFIAGLVETSLNIMQENKWLILGPVVLLTVFAVWVVYLRYRLSKRTSTSISLAPPTG